MEKPLDLKLNSSRRLCSVCKSMKAPMFSFPKDLATCEAWRLFFGLESATHNMRICSSHFRAEDIKEGIGRSRLVRHAFPRFKIPQDVKSPSCVHTRKTGKLTCIVPGCGKTSRSNISLHNFPRLYARRCQWATLIHLTKVPSRNNVICSSHFVPSDFHTIGMRKLLRSKATPSIKLDLCGCAVSDSENMFGSDKNAGIPDDTEVPMLDEGDLKYSLTENPHYGRLVSSNEMMNSEEECSEDQLLLEAKCPQDSLLPSCSKEVQEFSAPFSVKVEIEDSEVLEEKSINISDDDKPLSGFKSLSSKLLADISDIINTPAVSQKSYVSMPGVYSSDEDEDKEVSLPPEPCEFDKLETDSQLKSYTNVTYSTFNYLLKLVLELHGEDDAKFPMKKKIFLVLSKLFINGNYEYLGDLIGFPRRICGAYFVDVLNLLAAALKNSVTWPSREEIAHNMPKCFDKFSDTRVILCCFEVPLTSGDCSKYPIRLYAPSKSNQCIKILVGFAPSGLVTFVSEVYGGKAADKDIIEDCDLLSKLEPHVDAIMVDRGFAIHDLCRNKGIKVYTSPFVLKKQPLTDTNAKRNLENTSAWAHVKNVLNRFRAFKVLQRKISSSVVPHLDDVLVVVTGLVNLSPPILSDSEFITIERED